MLLNMALALQDSRLWSMITVKAEREQIREEVDQYM